MLGFELLEKIHIVVDQGEAGSLATTEVGAESEARDHIGGSFVHLGQFLRDLLLGDCGASWVENIYDLQHAFF